MAHWPREAHYLSLYFRAIKTLWLMTLFGTMILSDLQTRTLDALISHSVGNVCLLEQEVGIMEKINLEKNKNKQCLSVVDFMLLGSLDKKSRNTLTVFYVVTKTLFSQSDHKCSQETFEMRVNGSVKICPLVFGLLEMDVNTRCTQILCDIMLNTVCISSFRTPGNRILFIQLRVLGLVSLHCYICTVPYDPIPY